MRVEPFIQSTFDKYLSTDENEEYLFNFHKRYSNSDSFNANVNIGIRKICLDMGMSKEDCYCFYTSRHTFATMMLTLGADLYTTSKLLGHANVKTTQIYAKIVDSKKTEAVNLVDKVFD